MTTMKQAKMLQRAAAALGFLAVATVGGAVVLNGHDEAVHTPALDAVTNAQVSAYTPPVGHMFVINIENKGFTATWGDGVDGNGYGIGAGNGGDPYLATTLRSKGVLLSSYYGTAHNSQPNYVAQVSGQGPNVDMQADCQNYSDITSLGTGQYGQVKSLDGCIFPKGTSNVGTVLQHFGHTWKGYMDDMASPCEHPTVGSADGTQKATATAEYAVRHNPFMYFHDIIDNAASCKQHVVPLTQLDTDLSSVTTTPQFTMITPDLCNDGHDAPCANGQAGGLKSVDAWMKVWVPKILNSPAFKADGVLVITADESDGPQSDAGACCGENNSSDPTGKTASTTYAVNTPLPGIVGPGGGLIGALVISKWTLPGTYSSTPYNHYSLLASINDAFRVPQYGFALDPNLDHFGLDVYNTGWQNGGTSSSTASTSAPGKTGSFISVYTGQKNDVFPVGRTTRVQYVVHPQASCTGTLKVIIKGPGVDVTQYVTLKPGMNGIVNIYVKPTERGSIAVKAQYYGDAQLNPSNVSKYYNVR